MKKIHLIKKIKAHLIRIKIHRFLGFSADLLIYAGYLLKLSRWVHRHKSQLLYDDFFNNNVTHKDRINLYQFILEKEKLEKEKISYLEFGVGRGGSMKWWSGHSTNPDSFFWGFDTFEGLPEKYGGYDTGTFSLEGKFPEIDDPRITFIKGLFQDTLLTTLGRIDFNRRVIVHLDADLYSATLFVFSLLYPYLKKGDLIMFDEFGVPGHEFKAFDDFLKSHYISLKPVGAVNNYLQMVFEVMDTPGKPS